MLFQGARSLRFNDVGRMWDSGFGPAALNDQEVRRIAREKLELLGTEGRGGSHAPWSWSGG